MKKYIQIMRATVGEYLSYRLTFFMWRIRVVLQLLTSYFLWWAIFSQHRSLFGYTEQSILTYILLTGIARPLVMGTRTQDVGNIINNGDLSNYLIRPMSFIKFFMSRDTVDKAFNIFFAFFEITFLYLLLRPPVFIQTDIMVLIFTAVALLIGTILFFYFSLILSYLGFWTPDVWAPRFLSFIFAEFFTGMFFPLDILPKPLFILGSSLPFAYFIYFPLKIYLGQLSGQSLIIGMTVGVIWVLGLKIITEFLWQRGLRTYMAEGR